GAVRNYSNALVATEGNHLSLFFAIEKIILVLHGDELRQAVGLSERLQLCKLEGVHARCADVERLAGADHCIEPLKYLLEGRKRIEAMDLIEIDIVGAEAAQAVVDGMPNVFPRQSLLIGVGSRCEEDLGGDDD